MPRSHALKGYALSLDLCGPVATKAEGCQMVRDYALHSSRILADGVLVVRWVSSAWSAGKVNRDETV